MMVSDESISRRYESEDLLVRHLLHLEVLKSTPTYSCLYHSELTKEVKRLSLKYTSEELGRIHQRVERNLEEISVDYDDPYIYDLRE